VVEAAEGAERGVDDVPALPARYVNYEANAARVVLEPRIVEAEGSRSGAERQPR
jgi:hypothetical protein